jgi:hypothetical protein
VAAISATITCKVDPALIARTRVAVLDGVATVEIYDPTRESWNEIFFSKHCARRDQRHSYAGTGAARVPARARSRSNPRPPQRPDRGREMTLGYEAAREAAMAAFAKELATAIAPRCPRLSTHTLATSTCDPLFLLAMLGHAGAVHIDLKSHPIGRETFELREGISTNKSA